MWKLIEAIKSTERRCLGRWAEIDKQSTLLRLLLRVLQRLPMPAALLRGSSLQKTVGRLQKYRCSATPVPCEDHTLRIAPLGSSLCSQEPYTVLQYSPPCPRVCLHIKHVQ